MIYLNLPRWTSATAAANNAWAGLFPEPVAWTETLRAAFAELLVRPAGQRIHVKASHRLEPSRPPLTATVTDREFLIGRGDACAVVLPEAAIRREHARVRLIDGALALEDLGSPLGTFLGDRRLEPNAPEPLPRDVAFTIFPYAIECRVEQVWEPDGRFDLEPAASGWWTWGDVPKDRLLGCGALVEPGAGHLWMGVQQHLIHEAVGGVLGADRVEAPGLLKTDEGCLDYLLNTCLERCNAKFAWPLRLEWQQWGAPAPLAPETAGLLVHLSVRLRDAVGAVRLFIPDSVLAAIPGKQRPAEPGAFADAPIPCRAQLAEVELTAAEAASLEEGDAVLIDPAPVLAVARSGLAWKCSPTDDNFRALRIDNPIERTSRLSTETAAALDEVPVLLQVLLAQKEIPLGELKTFAAGTLVDLGRDESAPVQLALNGKVLGHGELVRIDNRLGVKILSWGV